MLKFNKDRLYDKIYACWIGKNIGGTMGGPYEGSRELNDIEGFVTPPGEPLPTTIWTCSLYGCALWTRWELTE